MDNMHVSQTNMDIQLLIDSEDILYNIAKRYIYIHIYIYPYDIIVYVVSGFRHFTKSLKL